MERETVKVGGTYGAVVSGKQTTVKITRELDPKSKSDRARLSMYHAKHGGNLIVGFRHKMAEFRSLRKSDFFAMNLSTNRMIVVDAEDLMELEGI